jgi:hypothetical protein
MDDAKKGSDRLEELEITVQNHVILLPVKDRDHLNQKGQ